MSKMGKSNSSHVFSRTVKGPKTRLTLLANGLLGLVVVVGLTLAIHRHAFAQVSYSAPSWLSASWLQAMQAPQMPVSANPAHADLLIHASIHAFSGTAAPKTIPQSLIMADANGQIASYQPAGATTTATNAFFQKIGSNGRTCFSCHEPQSGWSMNPSVVAEKFSSSLGKDPIFAPVDGADCPDLGAAATQPNSSFVRARSQLFKRANFRVFLPIPKKHDWVSLDVVSDPFGCESGSYGLPAGMVSIYRRPLPAANLAFLAPGFQVDPNGNPIPQIMWDSREPSLQSQFVDASMVHAQATPAQVAALTGTPAGAQKISQGVSFQQGMFVAQSSDATAKDLTSGGVNGGPQFLATLPAGNPDVMNMFTAFANQSGFQTQQSLQRESIERGQDIFNNFNFTVSGVAGFNDFPAIGQPAVVQCAVCHSNQNVGNDFFGNPKHLGMGDNSSVSPLQQTATGRPALPPGGDFPLFVFRCPQGSIPFFSNRIRVNGVSYDQFMTTDPGVGLITGKCADLGKMKVPILRGLASRAPYFHDGSAATLLDVVNFYENRFTIGLTESQKQDLVNFLNSL